MRKSREGTNAYNRAVCEARRLRRLSRAVLENVRALRLLTPTGDVPIDRTDAAELGQLADKLHELRARLEDLAIMSARGTRVVLDGRSLRPGNYLLAEQRPGKGTP